MNKTRNLVLLACSVLLIATPASAEDDDGDKPKDNIQSVNSLDKEDLSVPEAAAFAVLGLTPQNVVRPTSPGRFFTSLLNGVDDDGNLQTGFAIEVSPYMITRGNKLELSEYNDNDWKRFLARTSLSLATAKGLSEEDESVRMALGLNFVIFDKADPRVMPEYHKCLGGLLDYTTAWAMPPQLGGESEEDYAARLSEDRAVSYLAAFVFASPVCNSAEDSSGCHYEDELEQRRCLKQRTRLLVDGFLSAGETTHDCLPEKVNSGEKREAYLTRFAKRHEKTQEDGKGAVVKTCNEKYLSKKVLWNKRAWNLAIAPAWTSADGTTDELESDGGGIWSSMSLPTSKSSQLILHARYREDESVTDPDDETKRILQDEWRAGLRFRFGRDTFAGSLEAMFVNTEAEGKERDESKTFLIGLERKIGGNLWLQVSFGTEADRDDRPDDLLLNTAFKYKFASQSKYKIN